MPLYFLMLAAGLLSAGLAFAQPRSQKSQPPASRPAAPRSRLGATAQRNENVAVYQIDNNAIKEANIRLGRTAAILSEAVVEASHYAAELGRPASELLLLGPAQDRSSSWHGELFQSHQNSIFNARTFFQAGPVRPSRRNQYGVRAGGGAGAIGHLTATWGQRKVRGMVNGNVLVPLASERTPVAADPAVRFLVQRFLNAYPSSLPNRLDFDPRALNTNAPQRIDETDGSLRLDRQAGAKGKLSLVHSLVRQRVDAFQLVAGQNPDTEIHGHQSQISYRGPLSDRTDVGLGFSFRRTKSVLLPEPNAVGPRVRFGYQIEELGPDSQFPIDRAQNSFRMGGQLARRSSGGTHSMSAGADVTRFQLNGIETNNQRGYFSFTNNFGRSAIQNLLMGTPSNYEVTIGELARGFRNWSANVFVADRWKLNSRLQIYYGMRYSLDTAPVEVNGMDVIAYRCDCNNFSPRFSAAYAAGMGWMARASYSVSFGQIQPVTYQQVRNNLPHVRYIQVQNPSLLNPLQGISLDAKDGRYSPTVLSEDLVAPYSHQYSLLLERRFADRYQIRLGYVGSRTIKLLNAFTLNRAEPVAGIPLTPATVDLRRPDPRFYEVRSVVNGGIAYFDAAQISFEMPLQQGLRWNVSYTFGKAIDEGPDFSGTAANRDMLVGRSQWQYDSFGDRKGLSAFDSTHSLLLSYSYDIPIGADAGHRMGWLLNGWQLSGASLLKSGTPITLYVGSDAPGFGNVDGGPSDRPNLLDSSILGMTIFHPNVAPEILRRDRFGYIVPGDVRGSLGRGTFRRAGIANFNAAVSKQWHWGVHREWTAQLRAEAYNLTNTPQFDEPQRNYSSPAFGKITNTLNDGRVLQLGLRLIL